MSNGTVMASPVPASPGILSERSWLVGVFIGTAAFGVQIPLFFQAIRYCCRSRRKNWSWRLFTAWILYTVTLFALNGLGCAAQIAAAELAFIENRDFPGGAVAYLVQSDNVFVNVLGNVLFIVNPWYQDGLLLLRFWCLQREARWLLRIFLLPLFISEIALGSTLIGLLTVPGFNLWTPLIAQLLIAYFSLSLTLNLGITISLVHRIFLQLRAIRLYNLKDAGDLSSFLLGWSISLPATALLYSCSAVIFLVAHGGNSAVPNLVLPAVSLLQSIVPLIDIASLGPAKNKKNSSTSESLPQARPSSPNSDPLNRSGAGVAVDSDSFTLSDSDDGTDTPLPPLFADRTRGHVHDKEENKIQVSDLEGVIVRRSR